MYPICLPLCHLHLVASKKHNESSINCYSKFWSSSHIEWQRSFFWVQSHWRRSVFANKLNKCNALRARGCWCWCWCCWVVLPTTEMEPQLSSQVEGCPLWNSKSAHARGEGVRAGQNRIVKIATKTKNHLNALFDGNDDGNDGDATMGTLDCWHGLFQQVFKPTTLWLWLLLPRPLHYSSYWWWWCWSNNLHKFWTTKQYSVASPKITPNTPLVNISKI